MASKAPRVDQAEKYARDVVAGRVLACRWVRLACQRHLSEKKRKDWRWVYDRQRAEKSLKFIELLPHVKGEWASRQETLTLQPWQKFIVAVLFGWVDRKSGLRRFTSAYIEVPRKNGKSSLAAGIGLYLFAADGEHGAEVYSGATTERQAWEVFGPARLMAKRTKAFQDYFGVTVGAQNLAIVERACKFAPVVGKPGDGSSPHCWILDEFHEHQTDEQRDTARTGMGARPQPLLLQITTAGADLAGPCYAERLDVQSLLEGTVEDERTFGIIYTIDEGDDWTTEQALRKANPNYGISARAEFLRDEQQKAIRSTRLQNTFKTKHLNVWVAARSAYFNLESWQRNADPQLDPADFEGEPCAIGIDLAAKLDLTSVVRLYQRQGADDRTHWYAFGRHYLPEAQAEQPEKRHYQGWVKDGALTATDGNIIDYERIETDLIDDSERFDVTAVGYDPHGATQLAQQLQDERGLQVIEVPQRAAHLSEPMKWVEALIEDGRLHHDGDPVLTWAVANVTAREFADGTVMPRKDRPESKIDPLVALVIAMAVAEKPNNTTSVYEGERPGGVLVI